ncbi:MAG: hypothetical protein IPP00_05695 [Actinomycetales bacterium]|uniref:Uncharacterized protein n=1 Tax=Candidatus Phosphoribacter hodrii TaxID=2953743 RepID=A0A9D7T6D1_9MICO|nr:hypothetical protein [Candidatus Phosphoribacter hodrii]
MALIGFGQDSLVEVSSGLIILWQFSHHLPESRERVAQRLMALSFFALAGYVTFRISPRTDVRRRADTSPVGIRLAIASLIIMPILSWAQRRTGRRLGSGAVVALTRRRRCCAPTSRLFSPSRPRAERRWGGLG